MACVTWETGRKGNLREWSFFKSLGGVGGSLTPFVEGIFHPLSSIVQSLQVTGSNGGGRKIVDSSRLMWISISPHVVRNAHSLHCGWVESNCVHVNSRYFYNNNIYTSQSHRCKHKQYSLFTHSQIITLFVLTTDSDIYPMKFKHVEEYIIKGHFEAMKGNSHSHISSKPHDVGKGNHINTAW